MVWLAIILGKIISELA